MAWVENLSDIDREIDTKDHEPIAKEELTEEIKKRRF